MSARRVIESAEPGVTRTGWVDIGDESVPVGIHDGRLTFLDAAYGVHDDFKRRHGDADGSRRSSDFQRQVEADLARGETSGTTLGVQWKFRADPETTNPRI